MIGAQIALAYALAGTEPAGVGHSALSNADISVRRARLESRQWLAKHGLLKGALRIRAQGGPLNDQANRVEVYSGFAAGSVLRVSGDRVLAVFDPRSTPPYSKLHKLFAVMDVVMPEHTIILFGSVGGQDR